MAVVYIPDNLISRILQLQKDKSAFVKEAVEEKLKHERQNEDQLS